MVKLPGLRWKIYCFLYMPLALGGVISILSSDSVIYKFYHILEQFAGRYALLYSLNLYSAFFGVVTASVLFLYAFEVRFLSSDFWKAMLILKIIFDFSGHLYEWKFMKSTFYADVWMGASVLFLVILALFPSYLAFFRYAFDKKK